MSMSEQNENDQQNQQKADQQNDKKQQATDQQPRTTLTDEYEKIRHSTDSKALSQYAHVPLPPKSDQAAYSRQTALLEAVAGNLYTPVEDRRYLAETMPFPNVLVKLESDPEPSVRQAVAANKADKNWLVGLLAKDENQDVRTAALTNPRVSWKMRLEGAQDGNSSVEALKFLAQLGISIEKDANPILAAMVRHAVALNPTTPTDLVKELLHDPDQTVQMAAHKRLEKGVTESVQTPLPVQSVPGHGKIGLRSYPKGFTPVHNSAE
jgi:hypothetical protein